MVPTADQRVPAELQVERHVPQAADHHRDPVRQEGTARSPRLEAHRREPPTGVPWQAMVVTGIDWYAVVMLTLFGINAYFDWTE
jgi:hypothetical protein